MITDLYHGVRVGRDNRNHLDLSPPPEWTESALCAQTDPDAFFPGKGGSTAGAKRVCGLCPVREECLRYALDRGEQWGVWGGLSERERRRIRAAERAVA